jgi:hypothetical protein
LSEYVCVRAASLFHSVFVFSPAAVAAAPFCAVVVVNELANHYYYYALIAAINYTHTLAAPNAAFLPFNLHSPGLSISCTDIERGAAATVDVGGGCLFMAKLEEKK